MLTGENGIISQAQGAKEQNKIGEIEEQVKLAVMDAKTEGLGTINYTTLNSELQKIGYLGEEVTALPVEIEIDEVKVTIDANGNVETVEGDREESEKEPEDKEELTEPTTLAESKTNESDVSINTTFEDTKGDSITIPAGFNVDKDSPVIVTEGIVVEDSKENQYVWIPVFEKSDERDWGVDYETAGVTTVKTGTYEDFEKAGDFTKLESALKSYTSDYIATTCEDSWYGDSEHGQKGYYAKTDTSKTNLLYYTNGNLTEDNYEKLYNNMLISVYRNGGFYIGRYEMGIDVVQETQEKTALEVVEELTRTEMTEYKSTSTNKDNEAPTIDGMATPISKENAVGYMNITQSQAQMLAEKVGIENNYGDITSSMMFGVQWNATCVFLEKYGKTQDGTSFNYDYLDDSDYGRLWGSFSNSTFTMNRGYYNIDNNGLTGWNEKTEKTENGYWLCTTGASDQNSALNIYDFGGNMAEFTLERLNSLAGNPVVPRGGNYDGNGAADYRAFYTTYSNSRYYTSRVMLYL